MNLFDYHEYEDFSIFKTENRVLFEILSHQADVEGMKEAIMQHPEYYEGLDLESVHAIGMIAGIKLDPEEIKTTKEDGREVYDLCKAFEDYKAEGRAEGRMEDIKKLMKNLQLSFEEVMKLLEIPTEERDQYRSALQ